MKKSNLPARKRNDQLQTPASAQLKSDIPITTEPGSLLREISMRIVEETQKRPESLPAIERLVGDSGVELKSFYAGTEYGLSRGFEVGHARGMLFGFVGAFVLFQIIRVR